MADRDDVETFYGATGVRETAKALLVRLPLTGGDREVWIPKSVIHDDSEVYKQGTDGELVVMRWFAEKEGLS